jgi:hypothetical protein
LSANGGEFPLAVGGTAIGKAIGSGETTRISATGSTYGTLTLTVTGKAYTATGVTGGTAATATFAAGAGAHAAVTAVAYVGLNTAAFNNNIYTLAVDD